MRLSKSASFYLQASIILMFLAGSSAPTPLYAVYQAAWHFTPITVTVVFGIYAVAVLATLLVAGSLSDYVGRRPVLLVAALVQAATMIVFIEADGVGTLIAARIVQGIATGLAAGAVGAGMLDLDRQKGTIANAVGPMMGTATGALLSGLLVQFLPWPTTLVYVVLGAIFFLQAVGVVFMPESVSPRAGALASLRPQFRLPPATRHPMMIAAPALVAAWALAGFYGSLGPSLLRAMLGTKSVLVGGAALFVLAASGAVAVLLLQKRSPRAFMVLGTSALIVGVALTLLAIDQRSPVVFFAGAVIAGAGFGASFQGAIRMVVPLAAAHERAGVLSVVYVIAYLAMGVPAILGGLRVMHGGGVFTTANEYSVAVIILAALAFLGTVVRKASAAAVMPAVLQPRA